MARTEGTETRRDGCTASSKYHTEAQRAQRTQRGLLKLAAWYIMERLRGRGYGWRGRVRV